jgi:hypothetical protein
MSGGDAASGRKEDIKGKEEGPFPIFFMIHSKVSQI